MSSEPVPSGSSASASAEPIGRPASSEPSAPHTPSAELEEEADPATYARKVDDPASWLREHKAVGWGLGDPCFEVRAGVPPEPALLCRKRAHETTLEHVYTFPSGRAQDVWQGPVATWANWVDLVVEIADDGTALVLRDRRGRECTFALGEANEKLEAGVHDRAFVQRIVNACKARGTYRWSGHKYVRAPQ